MHWIEAKANCTTSAIFEQLREVVRVDVEQANKHITDRFSLHEERASFSVMKRNQVRQSDSMSFALFEGDIRVWSDEPLEPLFTAHASLRGDGCCVRADGHDNMSPSEFSRLVLEEFFFGPDRPVGNP